MKTYRQSLDELHFTREEKNAMVDRLTAGESRGSGKVRSIRRTVTVGVAAAPLLTMGVGGGATPTSPHRWASAIYRGTVPSHGAKDRPWPPMLLLHMPLISSTNHSSTSWTRPGFSCRRWRVMRKAARASSAMRIQLTSTDCDTGIPPKMGMVKAVGFSSCAVNSSLICSKISPPEVRATLYSPAREKGTVSKVKKMGNFDKKHWGKIP